MAKIDNRSLDHKVLEHMRRLAVDRVLAVRAAQCGGQVIRALSNLHLQVVAAAP